MIRMLFYFTHFNGQQITHIHHIYLIISDLTFSNKLSVLKRITNILTIFLYIYGDHIVKKWQRTPALTFFYFHL